MTDKQAWFLSALGVLNGGVKAEHAARNAATLVRSLTKLENPFCALKGSEIENILRFPRPLSRFPDQSGRYMRENLQKVQLQYERRVALVLRLPVRRPVQQADRGLLLRSAQGRVAREGLLFERRVPVHRDRGVPLGIRGAEFCNAEINAILAAFGIERSVSRPGNSHNNAVVESTNHILKREPVAGGRFGSEEGLRAALFDWANW